MSGAPISVPGYEMISPAGVGGMATVWRAKQTSLQREVAIKVLTTELSGNPDDREKFRQEAKATALLSHPNVVQAYDAGEASGHSYYIMEFVEGVTVSDLLENDADPMTPDRALFIARTLADALNFCWKHHGMIHCDIKPENVMIDLDGAIKLADLGLARVLGSGVHHTEEEDFIVGTPNYMAPEQALGLEELDPRVDMYALGAMLVHMLTGTPPFEGLDPAAVLQHQLDKQVPDLWGTRPEITEGLSCLVEVLLAKDRSNRPSDWEAVLRDIDRVSGGLGPITTQPPPGRSTLQADASRPTPPWEKEVAVPVSTPPLFAAPTPKANSLSGTPPKRQVRTAPPAARAVLQAQGMPQHRKKALQFCLSICLLAAILYGWTLARSSQRQIPNALPLEVSE